MIYTEKYYKLGECNLYDDGLDILIVWERHEINTEFVWKVTPWKSKMEW